MKNRLKILIVILFFAINSSSFANENIWSKKINIWWNNFTYEQINKKISSVIENNISKDLTKKENSYKKLIKKLESISSDSLRKIQLIEIFEYWITKIKEEKEEFYSKVQKVSIWKSTSWKEIFAYYRWNPDEWYFWVFSNIHGWYEYWTYNSAKYMIEELHKLEEKTGWFIIPTINPDWLDYYKNSEINYQAYLEWRVNSRNVDLNRNFCTNNFLLRDYYKNWYNVLTWINWCNSEIETKNIVKVLKDYKFKKIISLHSQWNVLFLPDNSFDDNEVRNFWYQISDALPSYEFEIDYINQTDKENKIKRYEIDEWWSWLYTWTMETYIYEKLKIPTVLIELKNHGEIEYNLKNVIKLFDDKKIWL